MIDIKGIDKATLVAALFNNSKPRGLGFFSEKHNSEMTKESAQKYLDKGQTYFDYLEGRAMKIDVSGNKMDPRQYDRDNGNGVANKVVESIRKGRPLGFKASKPTNKLEEVVASGNINEAIKLAEEQRSISSFKP